MRLASHPESDGQMHNLLPNETLAAADYSLVPISRKFFTMAHFRGRGFSCQYFLALAVSLVVSVDRQAQDWFSYERVLGMQRLR